DVRVLVRKKASQLLEPAIPPDPAVHRQGDDRAAPQRQSKQPQPQRHGRIPQPVADEHQEECGYEAEHGPAACFEHFDRPDAPPKRVELRLQSARQLQPVVRLNETHDSLRECRNGPEWLLYLYHKRIKPDQYISAPPRKSPSTE